MEDKILDQIKLGRWIREASDNLRKASQGKPTLGAIEARLASLESYKARFDAGHAALRSHHKEDVKIHEYWLQDVDGQVEEAFVIQKGNLLDQKAEVLCNTPSPTPAPTTSARVRKVNLPTFDGTFEAWPAFRDLFCSIIDREEQLPKIEKLQHLKTSLKGEAERLVRDLPTTEANYGRTWDVLTEHYENKRILVDHALSKLSAVRRMKSESASQLKEILLSITSVVNQLEGIGRPVGSNEDLLVHLVVALFDNQTRREWETNTNTSSDPPTWSTVKSFMTRHVQTLEKSQGRVPDASSKQAIPSLPSHRGQSRTLYASKGQSGRCHLCKEDHPMMMCAKYKTKTGAERKATVEQFKLCFNCLGKHLAAECPSSNTCYRCHKKHHTSLHDAYLTSQAVTSANTACEETQDVSSHTAHQSFHGSVKVLLATARILVEDRSGSLRPARALIDQGSETSMITERLAQVLKLTRSRISVAIFGIGGVQTGVARGRVTLNFRATKEAARLQATALVIPRLSVYASQVKPASTNWDHIRGLPLADPEYARSDQIDIILGADVYSCILLPGLRRGLPRQPIAQDTKLGWILSGQVEGEPNTTTSSMQCVIGEPLNQLVRSFWEQEEVETSPAKESLEDKRCDKHYRETHQRDASGRYVVKLPFKTSTWTLPSTRPNALRSLMFLEKRFPRHQELQQLYSEFLRQYTELNHMSPVSPPHSPEKVAYLPHHGVMRETSTTTRLRVVFNGSSKTPNGQTLNDQLLTGPNLLPTLPDILLRQGLSANPVAPKPH